MSQDTDKLSTREAAAEKFLQSQDKVRPLFKELPVKVYDFINQSRGVGEDGVLFDSVERNNLVAQIMLAQMQQEYHCCVMLANYTYGSSAAAIASSIYESFYIFTSILYSTSKADTWFEYARKEEFGFNSLKNRPAGLDYGVCRDEFFSLVYSHDKTLAESEKAKSREIYASLSAFRHGNASVRNKIGYFEKEVGPNEVEFTITPAPVVESFSLQSCGFSIYHASRYMLDAASGYFHAFGENERKGEVYKELNNLLKEANDIYADFKVYVNNVKSFSP